MHWNCIFDTSPSEGEYVLIDLDGFVGIAQWIDGDWDTVGANRKHFIFAKHKKLYSSAQPEYWAPLPTPSVRL